MDPRRAVLLQALHDPLLRDQDADWLAKQAKRLAKLTPDAKPTLRPARISVSAGFTATYLLQTLPLFLAQRGIDAVLRDAPYGTLFTDILDADSGYRDFDPTVTLFLPTHHDLQHVPAIGDSADRAEDCVAREVAIWQGIWANVTTPMVQLTYGPPDLAALGGIDGGVAGGLLNHCRRVNLALAAAAPASVTFVDAERLAAELGASQWHDPRLYAMAKQPFAMAAIPAFCNALAASIAGVMGTGRKALILDLDNTLWGGVIGDQGVSGITLGSETAEGEGYVAFQRYVDQLRRRGVVLAVCSKNDPDIAREPFRQHAAMVLKEDHIACFVANFDNKADNIRHIAKTLNLGLDSLVFVDDSPVECALIRSELPDVWTVELSCDPAEFAGRLDRIAAFPIARLTGEDIQRSDSYVARSKVEAGIQSTADMDGFLRDLEPRVVIEGVRDDTRDRITQLLAKTNQFKLNPTVFSATEIDARAGDVIALRFRDRLQDYGIVAIAVTETRGEEMEVINWVMSCRVFSRRLEYFMRELLAKKADQNGATRLCLRYTESNRNQLIRDLLPKLGFSASDGDDQFHADAAPPATLPPSFIEIDA